MNNETINDHAEVLEYQNSYDDAYEQAYKEYELPEQITWIFANGRAIMVHPLQLFSEAIELDKLRFAVAAEAAALAAIKFQEEDGDYY